MRYLFVFILATVFSIGTFFNVFAQQSPTLTVVLDSNTPSARNVEVGAQYDVARINLTASGGDIFINGIYLNTDISGGLSNLNNIFLYDITSATTYLGAYPNQSEKPNLIEFGNIRLDSGATKKYLLTASFSDSAAGNIRLGFSGFTFSTLQAPTLSGVPAYGNIMTVVDYYGNPIYTPTPTPTPTQTPTPSPSGQVTPVSLGFTSLAALNLTEGDTISATGSSDPDIYIANSWGYKRLFLNPAIFNFYGHLGGFTNVKTISSSTRNMLVTSGLFRNCETNDPKIYGVEITGEDTGTLHWINTSGEQAVADDPDFFKKVFCINNNEFSWYAQGSAYTSVNQVPTYSR